MHNKLAEHFKFYSSMQIFEELPDAEVDEDGDRSSAPHPQQEQGADTKQLRAVVDQPAAEQADTSAEQQAA